MKKEVDFNIFKAQILDQARLSGIPQCPQKMDDACPNRGIISQQLAINFEDRYNLL